MSDVVVESPFVYPERKVSEVLGVARRLVTSCRKNLHKGAEWELVRGEILLSVDGIKRLVVELGLSDDGDMDRFVDALSSTRKDAPEVDGDRVELVVSKFFRNPRILGATLDGVMMRVKVKDTKNFRKGMLIPCKLIHADLYELDRALPRYPGRW